MKLVQKIIEVARRGLLVLWNVYAFFTTYARLAGWATPRAEDTESCGMRHSRGVADTLSAQTGQDLKSSDAATVRRGVLSPAGPLRSAP